MADSKEKLLHELLIDELRNLILIQGIFSEDDDYPNEAREVYLEIIRRICFMLENASLKPEHARKVVHDLDRTNFFSERAPLFLVEYEDWIHRILDSCVHRLESKLSASQKDFDIEVHPK